MASLFDLADKLGRGIVRVRGAELPIRALTERETAELDRLWPVPLPPLTARDPTRGSLAPPIANPADEGYRRAMAAWNRQRWALEVVIATGSAGGGGDKVALETAVEKLVNAFSEKEIVRMWEAVRDLFDDTAQQRALDALVVDASGLPADAVAAPLAVPGDFATTKAYRLMRGCERFGIWPWMIADLHPGWMYLIEVYDAVRSGEEREERAG